MPSARPVARQPARVAAPPEPRPRTLRVYISLGEKMLYTGIFMLFAFIPLVFLAFLTFALAGPEAALAVGVGGPLATMGFYLWKLRVVELTGRFTLFPDRVECVAPHSQRVGTELTHKVVHYADVGHLERTSKGILLRQGVSSSEWMDIQVHPEHRDSVWEEVFERMHQAAPPDSVFSLIDEPDGPTRYSGEGDPLELLWPRRGVSGAFHVAPLSGNEWEVRSSRDERFLFRLRREDVSSGESADWNWYAESEEGDVLAYIRRTYRYGATSKFKLYGPRGVELGRLTVLETGYMQHEAELVVGEQQVLRWSPGDGTLQVEQNGQPIARVGGTDLADNESGVVTKRLPFFTFLLVVTVAELSKST